MNWRFWRQTTPLTLAEQRAALSALLERDVPHHPQHRPRYITGMEEPDPRKFAPMNRPQLWRKRA